MSELEKIAPEWSICYRCKNNNTSLCMGCTSFYGYAPAMICGIPCGVGNAQFYHKNYVKKEKSDND